MNLTFEDGVRYDGVVTYSWSSGCHYTDEIKYTHSSFNFNYTFPNGTNTTTFSTLEDSLCVIGSDTTSWASHGIPIGGSTYFATAGQIVSTLNIDKIKPGVHVFEDSWTSLVKCTPTFDWQVSTCTWKDGVMTACMPAPGHNTTSLDLWGLSVLHYYMNAIPWSVYLSQDIVFNQPTLAMALMYAPTTENDMSIVAPSLSDFDNLYGQVAKSISSFSSVGYFGTATVPTVGSPPRPVYVIRMYILATLVAVLLGVPLVTAASLLTDVLARVPIRRATFLTIANAVRGPWWDSILCGGFTLSPSELRHRHRTSVGYGVDVQHPRHVGLGPQVSSIEDEARIFDLDAPAHGETLQAISHAGAKCAENTANLIRHDAQNHPQLTTVVAEDAISEDPICSTLSIVRDDTVPASARLDPEYEAVATAPVCTATPGRETRKD